MQSPLKRTVVSSNLTGGIPSFFIIGINHSTTSISTTKHIIYLGNYNLKSKIKETTFDTSLGFTMWSIEMHEFLRVYSIIPTCGEHGLNKIHVQPSWYFHNNTSKVVRIPFSHMVLSTLLQSNQVFAIKYGTLLCHVVSWEDQTKIKLISEMTMPITTKLVIEKLKWHNQLLAYPTHVYYTKAPRKKRCFDGLHSNYQRCYCVLFL